MEALKWIPFVFLVLAIGGIVAGATAITIGTFTDTTDKCDTTGAVWNATQEKCVNASNQSQALGNITDEFNLLRNTQSGMKTAGGQFGTISVIAIMVIIISLLAGLFVYFKYFR